MTASVVATHVRDRAQIKRLEETIQWAALARNLLAHAQWVHGDCVHFRPGASGVTMVGLLADRPQRGKGGFKNLRRLAENFDKLFARYCRDVPQRRVTGEKVLQSFLIRQANRNQRLMQSLNEPSRATSSHAALQFITDELALTGENGKVVCDLLALSDDGLHVSPVVIELKDSRSMARLVEQVNVYATLVDLYRQEFGLLFSAVLGRDITFNAPCQKWIVWPAASGGLEPQGAKFAAHNIRTVSYRQAQGEYCFAVGADPREASVEISICVPSGQEKVFPACAAAAKGQWHAMPASTSFEDMHHLAYAIQGYKVCEAIGFSHPAEILDDRTERLARDGRARGSAAEIWVSLFFLARRFDHATYSDVPEEEELQVWHALYQHLVCCLQQPDGTVTWQGNGLSRWLGYWPRDSEIDVHQRSGR